MAGFGQFESYKPDPVTGGALFRTKTGADLLFTGPQADDLKKRIDAANGVMPQPTAQLAAPAPAPFVSPYKADFSTPNPSVQGAAPPPPPGIAAPSAQPVVDLDKVDDSDPAAGQGGGERIISQEQRKGGGVETNYLDSNGQLRTRINTAGTAAVTPEQLKKKAGSGVAVPVSGSQVEEGGFDRNADYEESLSNASIDKKLATNSRADMIAGLAEEERQAANVKKAETAKTIEQDRAKQNEIQSRVDKDLELMNQARDEFKSSKVDPNRIFHGEGGTFKLIGAAIGAAMGAYGATLSHTENFALSTINRALDRDVAAQEREIQVKGENANNALQQFRMSTGSLEQAKSALKVSQLEFAKAQASEFEAKYKSADAKAGAQATIAGLDESIAKELERYRIESLGKHTAQVSEQIAYPHAGSAGKTIDLVASPGKQKEAVGIVKERADVAQTEANTKKALADASGTKPSAAQEKSQAAINVVQTLGKRIEAHPDSEVAYSPETSSLPERHGRELVNWVGGAGAYEARMDPKKLASAQEFNQVRSDLMAQTSVMNGQGALSGPEAVDAKTAISAARTWGDLRKAHGYLLEKTNAAGVATGATPAAQPNSLGDLGKKRN